MFGSAQIFAALWLFTQVLSADQRSENSPEFDVLRRFVGTWEVQQQSVSIKERVATCEQIMSGRFVDCRSYLPTNAFGRINTRVLMTYDTKTKSYRSWIDWSNGQFWEAEGKWSQESATMTWIAKQSDGTRHFVATFVDADTVHWSIQDYNDAGESGWGTGGTNKRKRRDAP